jgi:hypothetical protein
MDTLWLALRADLRRKWRALVSLALLIGLAGGVVLTAAAGTRRTDTGPAPTPVPRERGCSRSSGTPAARSAPA